VPNPTDNDTDHGAVEPTATVASDRASVDESTTVARRSPSRGRRGATRNAGDGRSRTTLIAAAVAVVLVLVIGVDVVSSWGRVHPGVRVGDVAVGSMTPAEARTVLEKDFMARSSKPVVVTWSKDKFKLAVADLGARLDTTSTVTAAMAVGRDGGLLAAAWGRLSATFGGITVAPVIALDDATTQAALDRIDEVVSVPAVDAAVSVDGTDVSVVGSQDGRALDRAATRRRILAALASANRQVTAVVATVTASVDDAEAERAKGQAIRLISGPATVTFQGSTVAIDRATLAALTAFTRTTDASANVPASAVKATLAVSLDATRLAPVVASLATGRARTARDASFVVAGGKVTIVPSRVGTGPDLQTLASDLTRACLGTGARTAALKLSEAQPKLTTDAAKAMGIKERISTYTTSYATVNPARTNNVHLLAKTFDGKMVAPGATFSFNGTAGERTAAKGYQEAPAIVKGKLVPQLGGGVCQVGTTFFNSVFFSGLPIVERHNHSFYISHYPKGRDATVSWGGPDFKFKNETGSWILIHTSVTASTLTIALYGTDPGYTVRYTTGAFTDVVPHKIVEVPDPTHKKGYRFVEDGGVDGANLVVTRTVLDASGQLVRKDTFMSHYSPKTETVRVGTKAVSVTPTSTPTP
jgi:vancomycin resistance protein YoaR